MSLKLPLGDLNPSPYLPHPTIIYTCGVTIAPRVCGGQHMCVCVCVKASFPIYNS